MLGGLNPYYPPYPQQAPFFPSYPIPYGQPTSTIYNPLPTVLPQLYSGNAPSANAPVTTLPSNVQQTSSGPTFDMDLLKLLHTHSLNASPYIHSGQQAREEVDASSSAKEQVRYTPYKKGSEVKEDKGSKKKETKEKNPCRCGSTTHHRTNHHACPLNPDERWKLVRPPSR